ncbi:MAG: hypothetical protein PUG00_02535 [Clostridiales bacterium]|nr:hypothetical protein [Clostridiales bacterium]
MRERIKRKLGKSNDHGSSFVLVIVATTFMCILAGALLMGAYMTYKLKYYKLNSLNNFYEVEKALDEIYAGVGAATNEHLYSAYTTTAELVVTYDSTRDEVDNKLTNGYQTLTNEEANDLFKKLFITGFISDNGYKSVTVLKDTLEAFISNKANGSDDTSGGVMLSTDNLKYILTDKNGVTWTRWMKTGKKGNTLEEGKPDSGFDKDNIVSITFKNVCVKRTVEVSGSESGKYEQSITTDIVLRQPEYNVSFETSSQSSNTLYDYAILADMGIEVGSGNDTDDASVTINGNLYAASDYYNKNYNDDDKTKVTSYYDNNKSTKWGTTDNSLYSGIFVDGKKSELFLRSDVIVCSGTLAAYNGASIDLSSRSQGVSELWTDNIVIGGTKSGSIKAAADAYVFDDTELNAEESTFTLNNGRYFGYSYNARDVRSLEYLRKYGYLATGYSLRSHFGDSAIIVNGKSSTLDLSKVGSLYIAGKSYIEFSKIAASSVAKDDKSITVDDNAEYAYTTLNDYSTGQSLDVKTNQLIFLTQWSVVPNSETEVNGVPVVSVRMPATDNRVKELYSSFNKSINDNEIEVQAIKQTVSGHDYYYLYIDNSKDINDMSKAEQFVHAYYKMLNNNVTEEVSNIYNVRNYETFQVKLMLPSDENNGGAIKRDSIKTAGALTRQQSTDNDLYMVKSTNTRLDVKNALVNASQSKTFRSFMGGESLFTLDKDGHIVDSSNNKIVAEARKLKVKQTEGKEKDMSDLLSYMYINLKDHLAATDKVVKDADGKESTTNAWDLAKYTKDGGEYTYEYKDDYDGNGNARYSYDYSLTPLNYYVDFKYVRDTAKNVNETFGDKSSNSASTVIINSIEDTLNVNSPNNDDGSFRGIIVTTGSVRFGEDVKSFKGLIISGAKVYLDHSMTVSADALYISSLIDKCMSEDSLKDAYGNSILKHTLIKCESSKKESEETVDGLTISDISYEDILEFQNWKKNVQ